MSRARSAALGATHRFDVSSTLVRKGCDRPALFTFIFVSVIPTDEDPGNCFRARVSVSQSKGPSDGAETGCRTRTGAGCVEGWPVPEPTADSHCANPRRTHEGGQASSGPGAPKLGDQSIPSPHLHYPAVGKDPALNTQRPGLMTQDDPGGSEGRREDRCAWRVEGRPGLTSPDSLGEGPLPQTWPWKGALHSGSASRARPFRREPAERPSLGRGKPDRCHKKVGVQSRSKG